MSQAPVPNPFRPENADWNPGTRKRIPLGEVRVRRAFLILALPACINCLLWDRFVVQPLSPPMILGARIGNASLAVLICVAIWCFAYRWLLRATMLVHRLLGSSVWEEWETVFTNSLRFLPVLATAGGLVWLFWCGLFYGSAGKVGFLAALVLGGLGHLIAAVWYGSLAFSLWKLEYEHRKRLAHFGVDGSSASKTQE